MSEFERDWGLCCKVDLQSTGGPLYPLWIWWVVSGENARPCDAVHSGLGRQVPVEFV